MQAYRNNKFKESFSVPGMCTIQLIPGLKEEEASEQVHHVTMAVIA